MKPNVPKGKRVKVNLIKMGIVAKQPKVKYDAPVVSSPAKDSRVK
jgi:hypothetical protein